MAFLDVIIPYTLTVYFCDKKLCDNDFLTKHEPKFKVFTDVGCNDTDDDDYGEGWVDVVVEGWINR